MPDRAQDEPVFWFVILDKALHCGDLEQAVFATAELKRLGVSVTYDGYEAEMRPQLSAEGAKTNASIRSDS